jgi:hypothetical protein
MSYRLCWLLASGIRITGCAYIARKGKGRTSLSGEFFFHCVKRIQINEWKVTTNVSIKVRKFGNPSFENIQCQGKKYYCRLFWLSSIIVICINEKALKHTITWEIIVTSALSMRRISNTKSLIVTPTLTTAQTVAIVENYSWIYYMMQHFCYTTVALGGLFKAKSLKFEILTHLNYCSGSEIISGTWEKKSPQWLYTNRWDHFT